MSSKRRKKSASNSFLITVTTDGSYFDQTGEAGGAYVIQKHDQPGLTDFALFNFTSLSRGHSHDAEILASFMALNALKIPALRLITDSQNNAAYLKSFTPKARKRQSSILDEYPHATDKLTAIFRTRTIEIQQQARGQGWTPLVDKLAKIAAKASADEDVVEIYREIHAALRGRNQGHLLSEGERYKTAGDLVTFVTPHSFQA